MPRIIVTTAPPVDSHDDSVLFDELVQSVHLSTDHAAAQLIERLVWAINDAEDAEQRRSGRPETAGRRVQRPAPARRRARRTLAA